MLLGGWNCAGMEPGRPGKGDAEVTIPGGGDMPGAPPTPGAAPAENVSQVLRKR